MFVSPALGQENTTYQLEEDLFYYETSAGELDDYIKERCFLDLLLSRLRFRICYRCMVSWRRFAGRRSNRAG